MLCYMVFHITYNTAYGFTVSVVMQQQVCVALKLVRRLYNCENAVKYCLPVSLLFRTFFAVKLLPHTLSKLNHFSTKRSALSGDCGYDFWPF